MYILYCRIYQWILRIVSRFLPWRVPQLLTGEGKIHDLAGLIVDEQIMNVLVITDEGIMDLGLMEDLLRGLEVEEVRYAIYDKTVANPTIDNIEQALEMYRENHCEGIVAFGGGSPWTVQREWQPAWPDLTRPYPR